MTEKKADNSKPLSLELKIRWVLRAFLLVVGIFVLLFGGANRPFGFFILVALVILTVPEYWTRGRVPVIPVAIEVLILLMVLFEFVGGDILNLYERIPHYDNFMHFMLPLIIALIITMFFYTAFVFGKLKTTLPIAFVVIILMTIGLGGVLEMAEYTYDQFLMPHFGLNLTGGVLTQGSPTQSPLQDTMNDLFTDTAGAIVGALIGVYFIRKAEKEGKTLKIANEIEKSFGI